MGKGWKKIYLTYAYQPVGKIKNEMLHVGRTSIRDVIVILKSCHHVASQGIQDFLEGSLIHVFFSNINEVFSGEQEKKSIIRVRMR